MKQMIKAVLGAVLLVTLAVPGTCLAATTGDQPISREKFFTMVILAVYDQQTQVGSMPFADQGKISSEALPYICKAYEEGVLTGNLKKDKKLYIDGQSHITRQDGAVVLAKLLKTTSPEELTYKDEAQIAGYAYPYISGLKNTGIMKGYTDNTFGPTDNITADQCKNMLSEVVLRRAQSENTVSPLAGSGDMGQINAKATQAAFHMPTGLCQDAKENLYVMDTKNNLIRSIDWAGNVRTLAGNAKVRDRYGFAVGAFQDGRNSDAYFNAPTFAVVNEKGELLVSDSGNNMIRRITWSNTYTYCGDKEAGYINGDEKTSRFNDPNGLAMDQEGNLYVADTLNHCIRKVDQDGTSTLYAGVPLKRGLKDAGAAEALFNEPMGLAMDSKGNLYVSDTGNQRIRKVDSEGNVSTLAGGGTDVLSETDYIYGEYLDAKGEHARFNFPMGLDLIGDAYLLVADSGNHVIRLVDMEGQVRTIAGNGDAGNKDGRAFEATFNSPTHVLYADHKVYICDRQSNQIRVLHLREGEFLNEK